MGLVSLLLAYGVVVLCTNFLAVRDKLYNKGGFEFFLRAEGSDPWGLIDNVPTEKFLYTSSPKL
jgi:hypothetical protein